ncbi:MAG TPA: FAD-linked oxidase C-terminal domain-containing protein [Candidatus Saccharimonadales bacterium]|nr:FAD-linked oxidase C-terminal domain-containing protein [Candidatus Saccharimonadales bacterium]
MLSARQRAVLETVDCQIAFDNLTRQLYATDASQYQIEPGAVAFPRNAQQTSALLRAAAAEEISLTPRGAGSGLAGGALGDGLVVEFARFNRDISGLDLERRTVRAGAGVVLDQLNKFLKPHGYCFGPDVATSSRATLGGMIANNSSGAHVPVYGCTADHVASLEVVLADGRLETLDRTPRFGLSKLVAGAAAEIDARMPGDLLKRWPGYGVDRFLREPNMSHLLAGSEGTLSAILSAELKIVPIPRGKSLALIFFASVAEAMQATVELLDLRPAAIEHVDRVLFDQTRGQLNFRAARDLLELDAKPCEAILIVEFFDDAGDRLAAVEAKRLGLRTLLLRDAISMNLVWNMRKAGLSLLTGCKGDAKPITAIEDTAVRPRQLPEYVAALSAILKRQQIEACFYGHAAAGLLHVRPVLDLHNADDRKKFRDVSDDVSALVRQFKGSLAAEHGVGIARTEYMAEHLGPVLLGLMREIKNIFDPSGLFNPGKLIPDGRYRIDTRLRVGDGGKLSLPFVPVLAFAAKDESFTANLEQCNGCGGCRKETPTMCPTFLATGEEIMSTRGRANAIRAALEGRGVADPLRSAEMEIALSNCLSCKACTPECPSNVNLALLKAELSHARQQYYGVSWRERLFSSVDRMGQMACLVPRLANGLLQFRPLRHLVKNLFDLSVRRPLPPFALERCDHWFARRLAPAAATRGRVFLWDDTFVRYYEPHLGQAAVAVLEAAGFEVALVAGRQCCGRPAFSQGRLDQAAALGRHNLTVLTSNGSNEPILFLEPSCYSMFAEDYRELKLPGASEVKARCHLFEEFVENLLAREPGAIAFRAATEKVAIHAHCHAKSLVDPAFMKRLVDRLPGRSATLLDTGCCGMAGAFGALESKYDLSVQVAQPLLAQIRAQPAGVTVVASGTSCRHQLEHLSECHPRHMAEVLAGALAARGKT